MYHTITERNKCLKKKTLIFASLLSIALKTPLECLSFSNYAQSVFSDLLTALSCRLRY